MHFHKLEEWITSHPHDASGSAAMLEGIRTGQRFYGGRIDHFPQPPNLQEFPRLPYPIVCVEIERTLKQSGAVENIIATALELPQPSGVIRTKLYFAIRYSTSPHLWSLPGSVNFDRATGKGFTNLTPTGLRKWDEEAAPDLKKRCLLHWTGSVARLLLVLNCANVSTELIAAPHALNKKRARRGGIAIYDYKVLVLRASRAALSRGNGSHESPRVHLRRGHIKHRKTGDFWWQPCVVGDRSRGIVMKDYRADRLVEAGQPSG